LPVETVSELADGRIYTGEQAFEVGLIDSLGNFTDAITLAADMGGLDTENPQLIYPKQDRKFSILSLLTNAEQSLVENFVPMYPILSFEWQGVR
jgi:protease-4